MNTKQQTKLDNLNMKTTTKKYKNMENLEKSQEIKLMIIENFIDYLTTNELERKQLKLIAATYIEQDQINELVNLTEIKSTYC